MFNKKHFYIFIRNKLISCDSLLPVALEVYERTGIKTTFVTFDKKTYNTIVQNYFLYDTINMVGELKYVGKTNSKYISRIIKLIFLIKLIFKMILQKIYIVQFGHLNEGVLSIIARINSKARTYYSETDAAGFSKFMFKVDYCRREKEYTVANDPAPFKGKLLHFGPEWLWLEDERVKDLPRRYHPLPRARSFWVNHVIESSPKYLADIDTSKPIIFYIITGFCFLNASKDENTTRDKFRETLEVLSKEFTNYKIFIKPHPISNMEEVNSIIAEFPNLDIEITYLHPSLIGYIAKMTIGNFYSTAMYDSNIFGTPIIEFTDYHHRALELSGGRSMRYDHVDYFIQDNLEDFVKALRECDQKEKVPMKAIEMSPLTDFIKEIV